jgi:predicted MFS family arabinose efflux permease
VVTVLAAAVGAAVANLYYAQPLLAAIAGSLHVGQGTAALAVTLTQAGYAIGLVLLLPLGDLVENRRLTSRILLLTALALVAVAAAPSFPVLLVALALVGLTSVVAQILVPMAAHLATPETRGHVVGRVTSGLLLGIMLARSVSSFAAAAWGWRAIFVVSAGIMLLTSLALRRLLPEYRPQQSAGYRQLLAGTAGLLRTEPVLLRRAAGQSLLFAAFTTYWTGVTFELVEAHGLSQTQVALFALVGAAGAAVAPVAGRFADRGHGSRGRLLALGVAVVAMLLAGLGAGSVVLLALAGVLLDLAVQSHQVLSLRDVYALRADARARLNSVYMGSLFVTSAVASAITGALHGLGWSAVAAFGLLCVVGALLLWRPEPAED